MLVADPVERAQDGPFGQGDGQMDPRQALAGLLGRRGCAEVGVAFRRQGREVAAAVGANGLLLGDMGLHRLFRGLGRGVLDRRHGHETRTLAPVLSHHQHRRLVRCAPAASSGPGRDEKRFVGLDQPLKLVPPIPVRHGLAQLLEHQPGRFVAKLQLLGKAAGGDAALVPAHEVDGPEPLHQRRPGPVEHGPIGQRDLVPAPGALPPARPGFQGVGLIEFAARTNKAVGPAHPFQRLSAGLLSGKPLAELGKADRRITHDRNPRHVENNQRTLWQG